MIRTTTKLSISLMCLWVAVTASFAWANDEIIKLQFEPGSNIEFADQSPTTVSHVFWVSDDFVNTYEGIQAISIEREKNAKKWRIAYKAHNACTIYETNEYSDLENLKTSMPILELFKDVVLLEKPITVSPMPYLDDTELAASNRKVSKTDDNKVHENVQKYLEFIFGLEAECELATTLKDFLPSKSKPHVAQPSAVDPDAGLDYTDEFKNLGNALSQQSNDLQKEFAAVASNVELIIATNKENTEILETLSTRLKPTESTGEHDSGNVHITPSDLSQMQDMLRDIGAGQNQLQDVLLVIQSRLDEPSSIAQEKEAKEQTANTDSNLDMWLNAAVFLIVIIVLVWGTVYFAVMGYFKRLQRFLEKTFGMDKEPNSDGDIFRDNRLAKIYDIVLPLESLDKKLLDMEKISSGVIEFQESAQMLQQELQNIQENQKHPVELKKGDLDSINILIKQTKEHFPRVVEELNKVDDENLNYWREIKSIIVQPGKDHFALAEKLQKLERQPRIKVYSNALNNQLGLFLEYLQKRGQLQGSLLDAVKLAVNENQESCKRLHKSIGTLEQDVGDKKQQLEELTAKVEAKHEELETQISEHVREKEEFANQLETQISKHVREKEEFDEKLEQHTRLLPVLMELGRAAGVLNEYRAMDTALQITGAMKTLALINKDYFMFTFAYALKKLKTELQNFDDDNPGSVCLNSCRVEALLEKISDTFDAFLEKMAEKDPDARRNALVAHWKGYLYLIFRGRVIINTYWPEETGLKVAFENALTGIEPVLKQHQIYPHRLELLVKPQLLLVEDEVEVIDDVEVTPSLYSSEVFESRAKPMYSQYTIVCDIQNWGFNSAETHNAETGSKSFLICLGKEAD